MRYTTDTQNNTRRAIAAAQPRTTSGVRLEWSDLARPACRHDPAWRNTGLRTAATTSGVAEMLASGHRLRRGGGRALRPLESHEVACLIVTLHLRSCAGVAECLPRLRAEGTPP